jgi:riboflavin synthase
MFTGLIEEIGRVDSIHGSQRGGMRIVILCPPIARELAVGDSVNVDGVCQTVVAATASTFSVEAVGDTLEKTTLGELKQGTRVNLERSMRADGRFGGHMVMGHVSGTARILSWGPEGNPADSGAAAWFLVLELQPSWADRVVAEGSIAVDGVSLTVAEISGSVALSSSKGLSARMSIIPHTRKATTLALKKEGDLVNIELDILASYVRAALKTAFRQDPGLTLEKLVGWGYS